MNQGRTWSLLLAACTLAACGSSGTVPSGQRVTVGRTGHSRAQTEQARRLLALINEARSDRGAPPLRWSEPCALAAAEHSRWMAEQRSLVHRGANNSDVRRRLEQAGVRNATRSAENIARGQPTARDTFEAWRSSPEHLRNMLDPEFTHTGLSYAEADDPRGTRYWTQTLVRLAP